MLDSSGYYALGIPAYVALLGVERWLCRRRGLECSGLARSLGNLSAGLGAITFGLFLAPVLIGLYWFGYEHLALVRWPEGSPIPWLLALFGGDLCYYLNHRAGHRVAALWAIHGVHHQCDRFDYTVAMRHPWLSDTYAALFYVPMPLLGVPPLHFFLTISLISFYAFFVHTRSYDFPGFGVLVTPRTHIVHHCRNPRYLGRNLGAMFSLWDRLLGTHAELVPEDPPDLGPPDGYRSHDGARSQWLYFGDLVRAARQAPAWRDQLRLLFGRPGWRPAGVARPAPPPARPEGEVPGPTRRYVGGQFAAIAAVAVYLLWLRDAHPLAVQVAASLAIFGCLVTVGGLLDGRPTAWRDERLRLLGLVGIAAALLALAPDHAPLAGALLALALAGLAWGAAARLSDAPAPAPPDASP